MSIETVYLPLVSLIFLFIYVIRETTQIGKTNFFVFLLWNVNLIRYMIEQLAFVVVVVFKIRMLF